MASLRKLMTLATHPAYWPALLRGVAATVEHHAALAGHDYATVIDVGANNGQFAHFASRQWPHATLHCFEPQPAPRAKIAQLLGGRVTLHACALGSAEGMADLHLASRSDSSSLLPLGDVQKQLFSMEQVGTLRVPVKRLDAVIVSPARPALLKIDVQGFEYEVLDGARALLPHIDAVYVEASFVELYAGQRLAPEVETLLLDSGFSPGTQFNVCRRAGEYVQADLLFQRPTL